MSDYLYGLLLGIVQGISEFLPISSSAHLIIFSELSSGKTLSLTLNVALHFGTLLAVLVFFYKDWLNIASASYKHIVKKEKSFLSETLLPGIILGSVPAAFLGLFFKDQIESYFHNPASTILPLAGVGILMWIVDVKAKYNNNLNSLSIKQCFLIGIAQAFALIPGVSRSGSTITCGRLLGLDRQQAARFSFLLGTPAMGGATLLHTKDLIQSLSNPIFYIGVISSFVVGMVSIKLLLDILKRYGFLGFAIYRVILAIILAFVIYN